MDFHEPNAPSFLEKSMFPLTDLPCDEVFMNRPSSEFAVPIDFASDGRYKLNDASFFDTEFIDPALLEVQNPAAMSNLNDYSPAMQYTQNILSPFHPEWHPPTTGFGEQQQNFQSQLFPNALDTSTHDGTTFDWPGDSQDGKGGQGSLADKPMGGQGDSLGKSMYSLYCAWPTCKKESFLNEEHFTQHLYHHRDEARDNFVIPGTCQWPGCRSRKSGATFQTKADFDHHLKRHMKVHWCNIPGCKHREGFARQHDLTRHLKSHSKERQFNCPDSSCTSASLGFPRKDKLDAHIKTRHPHLMNIVQSHRCNVYGCTIKIPFDTIEDLKMHYATSHESNRQHRCPVESCARHNNGFTIGGKLIEHIKIDHDPPKCKFDHCDFRSLGHVMDEHHRRVHFNLFECKLPGCEGSVSAFTYDRLRTHLLDHGQSVSSYKPVHAADSGDISFFKGQTILPCKYCSGLKSASGQNEGSTNDNE